MFVVTLSKTSLKKLGAGAACCALVVFSAMLGRFISTRTVAVAAPVNRIESAQDIQTWFTGYGLEVDGASITADKVKIPAGGTTVFPLSTGWCSKAAWILPATRARRWKNGRRCSRRQATARPAATECCWCIKRRPWARICWKNLPARCLDCRSSERTGKADFRRGLQRRLGRAARRATDRQHRTADLR